MTDNGGPAPRRAPSLHEWSVRGGHRRWEGCAIMGILNVTPDSFSDGGRLQATDAIVDAATAMAEAGALVLDVGGESTRPGATAVSLEEELARVVPALRAIAGALPEVTLSVDTTKPEVAAQALAAGAHIVNDVSGLTHIALAKAAAQGGAGMVLMRRDDCAGADIVAEARGQLQGICARAQEAGLRSSQLMLDAGLGFGTLPGPDPEANLALIDATDGLGAGRPMLVGASRKRFVGALANDNNPAGRRRIEMSVAVACRAAAAGAAMVRVHDVADTAHALSQAGWLASAWVE